MPKRTPKTDLEYLPQIPHNKGIPIGCIGAGFIMADCHLEAYRRAGFNPVAIASRRAKRAEEVAQRHGLGKVYKQYEALLDDQEIEVVDIGVPPDVQLDVIRAAVKRPHIRGILAQKPLGVDYRQAVQAVRLCEASGVTLAVNQNMRYDHSIRACKDLLRRKLLGQPVLATIDMRAIPHWMPWQKRLGWVTLRIMSIHHLDAFRFLFGEPLRVFASVRPDPRTARRFQHQDGVCLYILEYADGLRAMSCDDVWAGPAREGAGEDSYVRWRVEGKKGTARGDIGWPKYPTPTPSTIDYTTTADDGRWHSPRWPEVWFPDAFIGTMAQLLVALETNREPEISGRDNLNTMALVEACYRSAEQHRAVELAEVLGD